MAGSTLASPTADPAIVGIGRFRHVTLAGEAWRRFRRHRLAVAILAVLVRMILAVAAWPLVWQIPINDIDFGARLAGPSWAHPFGTADLGQDLFARMLYGGRISLSVGLSAMAVAVVVGIIIGSIAGISRGWVDAGLMWLTDLFLSLPALPVLLLLIYLFRDSLKAVVGPQLGVFFLIVVVIGGFRWMPVARLVRAQFLSLREKEFVEAARALGASKWRQVVRHILPNSLGPVIVAGSVDVAAAIILESTLSFLGLGFPPDIPTWGRILFDAKDYLDIAPHWALFAGAAISVLKLIASPPGQIIAGQILWQGGDLVPLSPDEMRPIRSKEIGIVFQEPMTSLNPVYTVGAQIAETVREHEGVGRRAALDKAVEMLRLVHIPNAQRRVHDYPHQF